MSQTTPRSIIRDEATGYGLFYGCWPEAWNVSSSAILSTGSMSRPYIPQLELCSPTGNASLHIEQGFAGQQESGGMQAVMAMYGQAAAAYDTTNKAPMPNPCDIADTYASQLLEAEACCTKQLASANLMQAQERALKHYHAVAQQAAIPINNPFGAQVLRIYEAREGGLAYKAAVFIEEWAVKSGFGFDVGSLMQGASGAVEKLGDIFGGLGTQLSGAVNTFQQGATQELQGEHAGTHGSDALKDATSFFLGGGLVGKKIREARAAQAPHENPVSQDFAEPQTQDLPLSNDSDDVESSSNGWSIPAYEAYCTSGTIYWSVDRIITLVAPIDEFNELFNTAFLPVVESAFAHSDIELLSQQFARDENMAIAGSTQQALAASNARFQAQQAAHQRQQAAYSSYNAAWQARSDAQHQQFRAASNAQFASEGSHGGAADYSEAIRGVNTYTTSDGREVEVSTHADHVYENKAGDVVGGSGSFDPGADWTEIH